MANRGSGAAASDLLRRPLSVATLLCCCCLLLAQPSGARAAPRSSDAQAGPGARGAGVGGGASKDPMDPITSGLLTAGCVLALGGFVWLSNRLHTTQEAETQQRRAREAARQRELPPLVVPKVTPAKPRYVKVGLPPPTSLLSLSLSACACETFSLDRHPKPAVEAGV